MIQSIFRKLMGLILKLLLPMTALGTILLGKGSTLFDCKQGLMPLCVSLIFLLATQEVFTVFSNSPLFRQSYDNFRPHREAGTKRICGFDVTPMNVGYSAYPLLPRLLKPFPESPATPCARRNFNYEQKQGSTRTIVERAFGLLKGRWRCLSKRLDE